MRTRTCDRAAGAGRSRRTRRPAARRTRRSRRRAARRTRRSRRPARHDTWRHARRSTTRARSASSTTYRRASGTPVIRHPTSTRSSSRAQKSKSLRKAGSAIRWSSPCRCRRGAGSSSMRRRLRSGLRPWAWRGVWARRRRVRCRISGSGWCLPCRHSARCLRCHRRPQLRVPPVRVRHVPRRRASRGAQGKVGQLRGHCRRNVHVRPRAGRRRLRARRAAGARRRARLTRRAHRSARRCRKLRG